MNLIKLTNLACFLLITPFLHAAEPAEFSVMLRGYCHAGNAQEDAKAAGGYGGSDNLPKLLPTSPSAPELYLDVVEAKDAVFAEKYTGVIVRLVNGGKETAQIAASDSRLSIVQEALDKDGKWKEIEYLPSSWCGNSYHSVYLPSKNYWEFVAPKYSGPQKTKLRFKLMMGENRSLYSPTYEGGVHPGQFTTKQGHTPTNIMDPHTD